MAIAPNVLKRTLSLRSTEELEREYAEVKAHYHYDSEADQIKDMLDHYLNASYNTNTNSRRIALEELLEERTGQKHEIEERFFDIQASDVSEYLAAEDKELANMFVNFFNSLDNAVERQKLSFILSLAQNKEIYDQFIAELRGGAVANDLYQKYEKLALEFSIHNSRKG